VPLVGPVGSVDGACVYGLDRLAALLPREPRDQVLAFAERLGQARKLRAVAEKIRVHGQHHIDGRIGPGRSCEQQVHEQRGVAASVRFRHAPLIPEDLLNLIRHHQQAFTRSKLGLANSIDQPQAAGPQLGIIGRPQRLRLAQAGATRCSLLGFSTVRRARAR
jgi:hypothetical protein